MRAVCRGAGARAGRHRRQFLRARRPFAAGDAADQPHPRHAGRGGVDPQPVRGADCGGLARRLRRGGDGAAGAGCAPRPAEIPLSFAQRRLWFLDRLEGPSPTYTIPIALRLRVRSTLRRWRQRSATWWRGTRACARCSRRRRACRASTSWSRGGAAAACGRGGQRGRASGALAHAARPGFDLSRELPLRAHVFAVAPDEHVLLLVLHHIAGDGWSLAPLARDLGGAYAARRRRRSRACRRCRCNMPTTRCGSMRCSATRAIRDSAIARQLAFWTETLGGSAGADRSADRPAAAGGGEQSRRHRADAAIGAELHARPAGAGARAAGEPVHGAAGRPCGAADAARGGHRHSDRQPDRGPHRQRARRSGRLLRQHAGAAHRHVGQSELPRAGRAGARGQPGGLQPPGPAVRAAGGGAQSGALAVAPSAVPGDAGAAERRADVELALPG